MTSDQATYQPIYRYRLSSLTGSVYRYEVGTDYLLFTPLLENDRFDDEWSDVELDLVGGEPLTNGETVQTEYDRSLEILRGVAD